MAVIVFGVAVSAVPTVREAMMAMAIVVATVVTMLVVVAAGGE